MRSVDTSPKQIVPLEDLLPSSPGVWPAPAPQDIPTPVEALAGGAHPSSVQPSVLPENGIPAEGGLEEAGQIPRWKRILDVTCILLSMPFWLPIVALVALWVKMISPGPIFFRQERVGFRGSRFLIFKFRTMKVNVETQSHERHLENLIQGNAPMTKLDAGDPRIIAGGRILRATGIDELPQLFNVLRGEMSLVGPRPCTPYEFKRYEEWQKERVNAAPGLTGYWQVNGKNKTTFAEMIQMDIFYTKSMSLWLDLAIILKTVPAILAQVSESRSHRRAVQAAALPIVSAEQSS